MCTLVFETFLLTDKHNEFHLRFSTENAQEGILSNEWRTTTTPLFAPNCKRKEQILQRTILKIYNATSVGLIFYPPFFRPSRKKYKIKIHKVPKRQTQFPDSHWAIDQACFELVRCLYTQFLRHGGVDASPPTNQPTIRPTDRRPRVGGARRMRRRSRLHRWNLIFRSTNI